MKILVTGGSGYLGTHVRKYFSADDFSRRSNLDVLRLNDVQVASDYDVVIHLAATLDKSPEASEEVFLTNIEGTVNVLRSMKEGAVFIFASTKDVYGGFADTHREVPETCSTNFQGQSPLEWSKLIAERYVEYYSQLRNFRSCIFRLSTVYGTTTPGTAPNFVGHFVDAINKGEPIRLPGGGRPVRDLLHVEDFAKACESFIDSVINRGLYNLGGGAMNAMPIGELVSKMEEISGLQAVIDAANPAPAPTPLNYISDLRLVSQELGWKPTVSIDEGIAELFGKQR